MRRPAPRPEFTRREFLALAGLGAGALLAGGCETSDGAKREASSSASGTSARVSGYSLEAAPTGPGSGRQEGLHLGLQRARAWSRDKAQGGRHLEGRAPQPPAGGHQPDRAMPVTLSGDEKKYVWMNGQAYPEADPISVGRNEHVRFEFRNMTMMPHPMHLHGHFFRVENGTGRGPMRDTVLVDPMQKLTVDWLSDNPGDWAFHCHTLYHQEAGMLRVVKVA